MNENDRVLPPAELAPRLAEVFDLVGPLYRRAHRRVEDDVPGEGLSVGLRAVLVMLLEHGPLTVPRMSRQQAISRQFVQRMANEAAARGLVEFTPNPAHRRSALVRLTPAGHSLIAALIAREHTVLGGVGGDLTEGDLAACVKVLSHLLRSLDAVSVD
ncbi:MarR family transcriptional regulator [Actinocorallia sp. API 0066]|uniref:MarR family winged helix-turn-helix transcriptional regulator n=1 Tax=Actinocorallia sp. API 0066 TaxID=2896846 RepID=UPI001E3D40DE|nr:MarR family transcriptional regulator [Actinocorallia sp. API 0066]MCD0452034.1 MarR family transcriptional regulator [Actinocorallia sp. API 0066]